MEDEEEEEGLISHQYFDRDSCIFPFVMTILDFLLVCKIMFCLVATSVRAENDTHMMRFPFL